MKYILILIAAFSTLQACNKALDGQVPEHSTIDGNVITSQKSAGTALVGVYSNLAVSQNWEWDYCQDFGHLAGTTVGSGSVSSMPTGGTIEAGFQGDMRYNEMEANKFGFLGRWSGAYKMVLDANWMITLTEKVPDNLFATGKKEAMLSEARFLRFFAHFYLFRHFCYFWDLNSPYGLIYRTEPSSLSNHIQARLTVAESYEKLLQDLDYCIENGPEFTDLYHTSKHTAKAFKAKLLAMRGTPADYAEVIKLADQVISEPAFALEATYTDVFEKRYKSKEVMFGRYFSPNLTSNEIGLARARSSTYYRSSDYLRGICASSPQYSKYINDNLVGYGSNGAVTTYSNAMRKIVANGNSDANIVANATVFYMRLAEVYLLKAEALARTTGTAAEVVPILNSLLTRAGDHTLNVADYGDKDKLMLAIYEGMLKELAGESGLDYEIGFRFYDKATGLRQVILRKERLSLETDIWKNIMPIPIEEFYVNTALDQNPGYMY